MYCTIILLCNACVLLCYGDVLLSVEDESDLFVAKVVSAARLRFFIFHSTGVLFSWEWMWYLHHLQRGLTRAPWDFTPLNCVSPDVVVVVVVRIIMCTIFIADLAYGTCLNFCADLAHRVTGIFCVQSIWSSSWSQTDHLFAFSQKTCTWSIGR